jgi:hypothetical protein
MDERQRAQADLIIAHELDLAARAVDQGARSVYAAHSAKGCLGSGSTVTVVNQVIGKESVSLLRNLLRKVGAIAMCPRAISLIEIAIEKHFVAMEKNVLDSARMASRRPQGDPTPSVLKAGQSLLQQVRADIAAEIEIERFAFNQPDPVALPIVQIQATGKTAKPTKNVGGKPLAPHWDDMWAEIAVQLWNGDLQPRRQSDITKAMADWFAEQGIEVGGTSITERARALWRRIEAG